MKNLPENAKTVFLVYLLLIYFFVSLLLTVVFFLNFLPLFVFIILQVFILFIFSFFDFFLLKKYFESYKYACSKKGLSLLKGYLLKRKISILKEKVIYTEVYSNPLQRHLDLCSIGIFCAGTGRLLLSQVPTFEAEKIKEVLCN